MDNSSKSDHGSSIAGQQIHGPLNFHGVVRDDNDMAVEGAAVLLFACYHGVVERLLGSTFTDRAGTYLISVLNPPDYNELLGFKIRAGKAHMFPEAPDSKSLSEAGKTHEKRDREPAVEPTQSPADRRHLRISPGMAGQPYRQQFTWR